MFKKDELVKNIISITLIVILSLILLCNFSMILQGIISPDTPPNLFGVTPLIVLTGSMEGDNPGSFGEGSIIFTTRVDPTTLKATEYDDETGNIVSLGDVIAFRDPASKQTPKAILTHRIIKVITEEDGSIRFLTQGDANNSADRLSVSAEDVIGIYNTHIEGVGNVAMFLQTIPGMIIFIGIPVIAFVVYTVLMSARSGKKKDAKTAELEAELARLREMAGITSVKDEIPGEDSAITEESKPQSEEAPPAEDSSDKKDPADGE